MKKVFLPMVLVLALLPGWLFAANPAPTVVIQSATMRPGTTLMDVVFRVNDPNDARVKVRALAFVDGVRSFANVIKPVTFAEGTESKLGDAIPTNTPQTITWDVAADWNVQLGQVKFEILAMDARGLLPFDWITIPAAAGKPALTISKDSPADADVLSALFWQYADGDPALSLASGVLTVNPSGGIFSGLVLANGVTLQSYSTPYVLKQMDLDPADAGEVGYADISARAGLLSTTNWHAANRPYAGIGIVVGWGYNNVGQTTIPRGLAGVTDIAANSYYSLALKNDGTVVGWGNIPGTMIPSGLAGVIAIAAGGTHCLALRNDGTVVGWGSNTYGETTIPAGLTGVTAIAAGGGFSLALKNDGTVVGWGTNREGQRTIPSGLTGVTAIAAGAAHSLALKNDGTVVGWGNDASGETIVPSGLTGVTAIAAGSYISLAIKNDGTVVGWGRNISGETTIPAGLTGVTAIAAGSGFGLALKNDGTVVGWGSHSYGTKIPSGLTGVTKIAAGLQHGLSLTAKTQ